VPPSDADDHISVTFTTLHHLAVELEDILKQLNGRIDDLYDRVEPVVLSWQGEAREMFVDKLDEWDHSAQDLQAAQKWLHEIVMPSRPDPVGRWRSTPRRRTPRAAGWRGWRSRWAGEASWRITGRGGGRAASRAGIGES
jgi:WXG100 family type VII secretion target